MITFKLFKEIDTITYQQLERIFKDSAKNDHIQYTLPPLEEINDYALTILALDENIPVGVIWNCDSELNEVFGIVLPKYRQQSIFKDLLTRLKQNTQGNLTFYGKPEYTLMTICAEALGYTETTTELLMIYNNSISPREWEFEAFEDDNSFSYYIDDKFIGSCSIFETDTAINIYEVFVEEKYRNQGYGTLIIEDVLWSISDSGKNIILQVSQNNASAVKCYKKCGFVVKDAITFYTKS
jgi:GNAT superfamily N-acetyltransferase